MSSQSSLRIAHVQPIALDIFGHRDSDWGTTVKYFLTNIAIHQAKQGDRPTVHLLTSGKPSTFQVEGVDVVLHPCVQLPHSMPVTARFGRQLSWSMVHALCQSDTDIIHFHGARSLHLMYGLVAWKARQQNLPLFSQDHGPRCGKWIENQFQSYAFSHSDAVFAANAGSMEELARQGVEPSRMHIVPNGYDPAVFYPGAARTRGPNDSLRVLVASRLWEDKDPLTMAAAVVAASQRGVQLELTVVGQGVLRKEVEDRLQSCSVQTRFIEHLSQKELADRFRQSDVLLLTSLREGWNQVTIEAMASGLPVLATDIPGIQDGVGDAGWLLPPKGVNEFAYALEQIARDPAVLLSLRERGLQRAQRFTWSRVVTQFREHYLTYLRRDQASSAVA